MKAKAKDSRNIAIMQIQNLSLALAAARKAWFYLWIVDSEWSEGLLAAEEYWI